MKYNNALYTPYGAYALKATYQRNLGLSTVITTSLVLLLLTASWIVSALSGKKPPPPPLDDSTHIEIDWRPPPPISKKPPQIDIEPPQAAAPKVGIPTPVPDEEILDDDVVIASRDELAEIAAPGIGSDVKGFDFSGGIFASDYSLQPGVFVPVEIYPELIRYHEPEYPRLARLAGITGTVVVWVVVDEHGNVIDARVYKSSGMQSLDEAAVRAAYKNKFKPGIQNGHPVKVPVTYNVEFKLTDQ
ncbi:MAG: energy transducer TonB [Candidatus Zixiibacteriota bacterium]